MGLQSGIDNVHFLKFQEELPDGNMRFLSERADGIVEIEAGLVKPIMRGEDVNRYQPPSISYYCIYPYQLIGGKTKILEEPELKDKFPKGYSYLKSYSKELRDVRVRQKTNPKYWYSCHRSRDMNIFETERIVTPEISFGGNMTISPIGLYNNTQVYSFALKEDQNEDKLYLLGILNSKILWWYLTNTGTTLRGGYFRFKKNYLSPFPIRTINFTNLAEVAQHDQMVVLVNSMLGLHQQLADVKTPTEKQILQRQIETTDKQIDALVYQLYGLTDEEIRIVEKVL